MEHNGEDEGCEMVIKSGTGETWSSASYRHRWFGMLRVVRESIAVQHVSSTSTGTWQIGCSPARGGRMVRHSSYWGRPKEVFGTPKRRMTRTEESHVAEVYKITPRLEGGGLRRTVSRSVRTLVWLMLGRASD